MSWNIVFTASGANQGDQFGHSVTISNQFAFVGAPGYNSSAGAVYQYQFSGTSWSALGMIPGNAPAGAFGYSVAIGDAVAVIGAPFESNNNGNVYIVKQASSWAVTQTLSGSRGIFLFPFPFFFSILCVYVVFPAFPFRCCFWIFCGHL